MLRSKNFDYKINEEFETLFLEHYCFRYGEKALTVLYRDRNNTRYKQTHSGGLKVHPNRLSLHSVYDEIILLTNTKRVRAAVDIAETGTTICLKFPNE